MENLEKLIEIQNVKYLEPCFSKPYKENLSALRGDWEVRTEILQDLDAAWSGAALNK